MVKNSPQSVEGEKRERRWQIVWAMLTSYLLNSRSRQHIVTTQHPSPKSHTSDPKQRESSKRSFDIPCFDFIWQKLYERAHCCHNFIFFMKCQAENLVWLAPRFMKRNGFQKNGRVRIIEITTLQLHDNQKGQV